MNFKNLNHRVYTNMVCLTWNYNQYFASVFEIWASAQFELVIGGSAASVQIHWIWPLLCRLSMYVIFYRVNFLKFSCLCLVLFLKNLSDLWIYLSMTSSLFQGTARSVIFKSMINLLSKDLFVLCLSMASFLFQKSVRSVN